MSMSRKGPFGLWMTAAKKPAAKATRGQRAAKRAGR